MKKYRSKPLEKEAWKLTRRDADVIVDWVGKENISGYNLGEFEEDSCYINIKTRGGIIRVSEGDYIIKGLRCEFYSYKEDIFEKTYEEI
jgi:hypothetical protein